MSTVLKWLGYAAVLVMLLTIPMLALPAWAGASDCNSLSNTRWMLGDWIAGGEKTVFHESWKELGPQTFEGAGSELSLTDGKILSSESLRLVEMPGGVFYIAKIAPNELPVAFQLVECSADQLVFANPGHDFPQRLEYRHDPDGRLVVSVSGGEDKGFTLNFERAVIADPGAPVLAAEDARFAAMTRADAVQLGSWLADDLRYVHSTGQVANRQQFVDSIASGEYRYFQIVPAERQVIWLGDRSALVFGRGQFQVMLNGNKLDLDLRYLAVYVQGGDGLWRLRAWQSLRLPQKPG